MFNAKINSVFILYLILHTQEGYGLPQGFSFPRLVSWNNNEKSLTILPNVKVQSPVKSSFINLFGKQNSVDNIDISKKEQQLDNTNKIGQGEDKQLIVKQNYPNSINPGNADRIRNEEVNNMKFPIDQGEKELISKFSAISTNTTESDNKIDDAEKTTELITETTTDEYETTTVDDEIFNRASPQLVASLLGILLGIPRYCSASEMFAQFRTDDFHAIMRKKIASLETRVPRGKSQQHPEHIIAAWINTSFMRHYME